MHFLNRPVVSMALRLCDHPVHFHYIFTYSSGNIHVRYNCLNISQIPVYVMVMMLMTVIMVMMVVFMMMTVIMFIIVVMVVSMAVIMFIIVVVMVSMAVVMFIIVVMVVTMLMVMIVVVMVSMVMIVVVIMISGMFVMMVPVYVEALFLPAVDSHLEMAAANAAFIHGFQGICYTRNTKRIQFLQHMFRLRVKFQKGGRKHIACRAHIAFQI